MKRLIVCCDGTWNDLEMPHATNVVELATRIKHVADDGWEQVVYYHSGVETGPGLDRFFTDAFSEKLVEDVMQAYRFLCLNYNRDDEVYLFGFSRGASTVRRLAGLIGYSGLLRRSELQDLRYVYDAYVNRDKKLSTEMLNTNWGQISIKALACWDTVGLLGVPGKLPWLPLDDSARKHHAFYDTEIGPHVENAFHAVAIDESRDEFLHTPMQKSRHNASQVLRQMWFPGDHGCVGGGGEGRRGLSNISLKWIAHEVNTLGLDVDDSLFRLPEDSGMALESRMDLFYGESPRHVNSERALHESVLQRWGERADYRPPNLLQFSDFLDSETQSRILDKTAGTEVERVSTRV